MLVGLHMLKHDFKVDVNKLLASLKEKKVGRSRWSAAVKEDAVAMVEDGDFNSNIVSLKELAEHCLNYCLEDKDLENNEIFRICKWESEGGNFRICDSEICEHYGTPSEIRKKDHGRLDPNPAETWIDVQSRGIYQSFMLILDVAYNEGRAS